MEHNRPRSDCGLSKAPLNSIAFPCNMDEICRTFGDESMLTRRTTILKAKGSTVQIPSLEDLLSSLSLPDELPKISGLAFRNGNVVHQ